MNKHDAHSKLATTAADLLGLLIEVAQAGSSAQAVDEAAKLHDSRKLYPRLIVSAPHGGGAVHLLLTLNDPQTDKPVVRMFEGTANAGERVWSH